MNTLKCVFQGELTSNVHAGQPFFMSQLRTSWPSTVLTLLCYHPSKQLNCSRGTCSGLMIWWPRCTIDARSGTRHVIPLPLPLLMIALATLIGGANPIMRVSYMTRASVPAPVVFPQTSLHIHPYLHMTPNPCTLGQQVTTLSYSLLFSARILHLMFYCSAIASLYTIVSDFCTDKPLLSQASFL